jgi:hypothetical protein
MANENRWEWDDSAHRFRDTQTGRFLSTSDALKLRDGFPEGQQAVLRDLTQRMAAGDLTVQQWERATRDLVRDTHAGQYVYGRGGLNAMTADDWATVNALADEQAGYLRSFAQDVAAGRLSDRQVAARSNLYLASSRQAYERGRAAAWNVDLPTYPGQGTICKAACKCAWSLVDTGETIEATWVRHADDSCSTCLQRASAYAPLVIAKSTEGRMARLWRAA